MSAPRPQRRQGTRAPSARRGQNVDQLLLRYKCTGEPRLRECLMERFEPLARSLVARFVRTSEPYDDLLQVARLALLKSIERYDPQRGTAFSSLAVPTICGELRRHLRDHTWPIHVSRELLELTQRLGPAVERATERLGRQPSVADLAEELEVDAERVVEAYGALRAHSPSSLDRPLSDDADAPALGEAVPAGEDVAEEAEAAALAEHFLARLPARNRQVLLLRFRDDLMQREIGARIGVSQMHVSRLIRESIEMLRRIALEETRRAPPAAR